MRARRSHPIFSRFYFVLARLIERGPVGEARRRLLSEAFGTVLEIGTGTGENLKHYPPMVGRLVLTEPDPHMAHMLKRRIYRGRGPGPRTWLVRAAAEALPFKEGTFDVAVSTLTMCSVQTPEVAASELARVLKPRGRLLVFEHQLSPRSRIARIQHGLTPLWRRVAGGCHLNRPTEAVLLNVGFDPVDAQKVRLRFAPPVLADHVFGSFKKQEQD